LVDLADILQALNAVSALAVLSGVIFVVFQLRQNAKLIKASNEQVQASIAQNKASVATSVVERFTDDSFSVRRKTVRDIVKRYRDANWEGFIDSAEDFEVRAFASYYDFTAYLAREGIIDMQFVKNVLGYRVTFDWEIFAPVAELYRKQWGKKYIWVNFEWLAGEIQKFLDELEKSMSGSMTTKR